MDSFSPHTLFFSGPPPRNTPWPFLGRPASSRAPPFSSWPSPSDPFDPPFIAPCSDPVYPRLNFARNNALHCGPSQLLYPSPSSSLSTQKSTIPLPEEAGQVAPMYSTHLAGVLDSPPVVRREDLASQKPLTPPPTMPHPTLKLPDADVDMPFYDQEVEDIEEEECDCDESCSGPSNPPSPHTVQPNLPLSPLSPSWDPPGAQALSMASSQNFLESEGSNALFSVCDSSAPPALDYRNPSPLSPHGQSSLLEVDHPLLAGIGIPWDSEWDPEPPSSSTSFSPLASLTDYDQLPPPSSPLISRLDLPDLEDDGLPKIVPCSPCRRSCSGLPGSDAETSDSTSDPVLALPSQQLLSLPGADTDDDLIPTIAASSRSVPFTPSQPLLFIDDPRDVPLPRSPSPEDFDLCLSAEDITDPELAQLFDLRKRSVAAERAARRLESLTEDVDLSTRAEARKVRKRERERSKEVGALLLLKLGDGVAVCPQEQSPECDPQNAIRRRGVIGNMSQLVAQMVFRRNETSRPLAKRKTPNVAREYVRSSLSDTVTASD